MSKLQQQLAVVRRAWVRTQLLKDLAVLAADALIAVLVLVSLDAIYHFPPELRATLLALAAVAVAVAAVVLFLGLARKRAGDADVALYVEARYPELRGTLIAAVEYEQRAPSSALQGMLVGALVADCLNRAAELDLRHVIDRRRLTHRAAAAAVFAVLLVGLAASRPQLFQHEVARVLAPWTNVPLNDAELAAENKRQALHQAQLKVQALQHAATQPEAIALTVEPGNAEVRRGGSLTVRASANRINGPFSLKLQASNGEWHNLDMTEDPDRPEHFIATLSDLTEPTHYKVAMGGAASPAFSINVYDPTVLKRVELVYHYPAYTRLPDATVTDNPAIEAIEGTQVELHLIASAPLQSATLQVDSAGPQVLKVTDRQATATVAVDASGQYQLAATDLRGQAVVGLEEPWTIKAIPVPPPDLEVLYPATVGDVHPMEEIAFAVKAAHNVGLKELRLYTAYNTDDPVVQKIDYTQAPQNVRSAVGQFTVPLRKLAKVEADDTITFHLEAEDLKGQVTAGKFGVLTVRELELFERYLLHAAHPMGPHAPGLDLWLVVNSTHDLEAKRKALQAAQLKAQCAVIGKEIEVSQEQPDQNPPEPNP
jgi:hypothetical protein